MMKAVVSPKVKSKPVSKVSQDQPWNVLVLDDPVNLMAYVTLVLQRVFGYSHDKAERMMMEVHQQGRSVVWSGGLEKAELFVLQLHEKLLKATVEKAK